jgi:hypothetical protein
MKSPLLNYLKRALAPSVTVGGQRFDHSITIYLPLSIRIRLALGLQLVVRLVAFVLPFHPEVKVVWENRLPPQHPGIPSEL